MKEREFAIIFVVIATIAVAALTISKLQSSSQVSSSPSPTPGGLIFNNQQTNTNQEQMLNTNQQKQIKQYPKFPGELPPEKLQNKKAVIETRLGKIEFEIYPEATKAASNFIFLTQEGFFNNLTFHRVVPGFVIQGGDPLGNGTGGPGYRFEDEPVTRPYNKGIVAMANAGPDTNGSQFFIMLEDNPGLPPNYTIFGKVISGQEVVDKIAVGEVMTKVSIENLK